MPEIPNMIVVVNNSHVRKFTAIKGEEVIKKEMYELCFKKPMFQLFQRVTF